MTELHDQPGDSQAPDGSAAPATPGHWLRQERERQGTTMQKIAADMHLSVAVIEAIEQNRFSFFSAPVFAVGHLRKYASLLGLPVDRVLELYRKIDDAPRAVDPVPLAQRAPEPSARLGIREILNLSGNAGSTRTPVWAWAVGIVALLAVAGVAWWVIGRHSQQSGTIAKSTAESKSERRGFSGKVETAARRENSTPTTAIQATGTPSMSQSSAETPSPSQPSIQADSAGVSSRAVKPMGSPPPGKMRLRFTFARESWIEVYDANGNRMVYEMGRVDLPRILDVEPPATIKLGDPEAVATEANGKIVSIPRKNLSGSSARFSIAADGSVR